MSKSHQPCHRCGKPTHIDDLDAKRRMTPRLRLLRLLHGQAYMLAYAAHRGYNFDLLECEACYGPGYVPFAEGIKTEEAREGTELA